MSDNFLDPRNCSVNDGGNERLFTNEFDDNEETPLLRSSDNPPITKPSKIDSLRDAIRQMNPSRNLIVHESDHEIVIRRPLSYGSTRHPDLDGSVADSISSAYDSNVGVSNGDVHDSGGVDAKLIKNRHKYYSKLDNQEEGKFAMPAHVLPSECYSIITVEDLESKKQGSLVTIFSIWSTMMGSSTLSIPWAIEKSGLVCGILLLVAMAAVCLYTAHLIVRSKRFIGMPGSLELDFTDICKYYMGRWGEWLSVLTSLLSLICAAVVYWILLSNFLYNGVDFIYDSITDGFNSTVPVGNGTAYDDVVCIVPKVDNASVQNLASGVLLLSKGPSDAPVPWALLSDPTSIATSDLGYRGDDLYKAIWNLRLTVPLFLVLLLFPLLNFKSPTFFTKTSALGTISILFLFCFVLRKAFKWGIHLNFQETELLPAVHLFKWSFPTLSGMLSLAYFIHNCILSILRNQKKPENNGRDLTIAFVCVMLTLTFIGVTFFITFPLDKDCLSDNLLNNLVPSDIWAFLVRVVLLVQLSAVFPMLAYVFRIQVLKTLFGSIYPGLKHVLVFNILLVSTCVSVAIFFPHIGSIIRYCGSICGFGYIFTLPSIILIMRLKEYGQLNPAIVAVHVLLIAFGAVNCVSQFFI